MTLQRRSYTSLPPYLQTNRNNLELAVTDDPLYEPEQAAFVSGYIGDVSKLSTEQLVRTPLLIENTKTAQKYQFTVGVAEKNPVSQEFVSGAFYDDLVNHIAVNGGLIDDPNRLFSTGFYVWTPPIDYDKIVNFARYFWTGHGTAVANGEYITKEAAGTVVTIHQFDGSTLVPHPVAVVDGLVAGSTPGDIVEDISTIDRYLYEWDGATWGRLNFQVVPDAAVRSSYLTGDWLYVTRTGPDFNRPVIWSFRQTVGRWVSHQVVINLLPPTNPVIGMIWEDSRLPPARILRIWDGTEWQTLETGLPDVFEGTPIVYTSGTPDGTDTDFAYRYDTRPVSAVDSWSAQNWWRVLDDITAADQAALGQQIQAARPIIEFWGNIETAAGDTRIGSNHPFPLFNLYAVAPDQNYEIVPITAANFAGLNTAAAALIGRFIGGNIVSTIFQYVVPAVGATDPVLHFQVSYASDGTPLYNLDLEAMAIAYTNGSPLLGYRFFRDTATGYVHSVWQKSAELLTQTVDADGLYDIPRNLSSNADHILTTSVSRSSFINHFTSVIAAQPAFSATDSPFGTNPYRFGPKNMVLGGTMIDPEESLFRIMAVLQTGRLDIPDAIRMMARIYQSVMVRFVNQLSTLWNDGTLSTPTDSLTVTATQACDLILTNLFQGRNAEFPFFYSVMGTFLETRLNAGVPYQFESTPQPIYIPNSPAQIGAALAYQPQLFTDHDGVAKIRGHDGSLIPAFGDPRDDVILNLENRFYAAVPSYLKDETTTFSSRFNNSRFRLADFYGNFEPNLTAGTVTSVVNDYTSIGSPVVGARVYSVNLQLFAVWDGTQWLTQNAEAGDVFQNTATSNYYIFNGFFTGIIPTSNRDFVFDYSMREYREVIAREFERFVVAQDLDFITNTGFDENDPFTWNYSSAGVEGNYRGIYRRVYGTPRPHSHPWEVVGYSIQPDWWLSFYMPTSTAPDGTPRYAETHPMWVDFQAGIVNPISGLTKASQQLIAPIPVDDAGELLDPIASGLIQEPALTPASLGDDWQYGDCGPVEDNWYASYAYSWTVALAGYLMKPGLFVDRTWSEFYRTVGDIGDNILFNGPAVVYNTTLNRPQASLVPSQLSLDAAGNTVQNPGLNAWIADYSVLIGRSANTDFNNAIRYSQAALGWKTSGFINAARTSFEFLSSDEITSEDFSVVLHQGPSTDQFFQSGVTIVRDTHGFRIFGTDTLNPFFTVELGAKPITGGQIELLEEFVYDGSNRTFTVTKFTVPPANNDTATFAVLVNGFSIQSKFITRLNSTQFAIDPSLLLTTGDEIIASMVTIVSNPGTQLGSFSVNNITVTYFQSGSGVYVTYPYGTLFETLNDVVNMLVGYGRWLGQQGWIFERLTNGTLRDWLGCAKAFASWATNLGLTTLGNSLLQKGQIFNFSVMGRQVQFSAAFGMLLGVENTRNGAYGVVDVNSQPILENDLDIVSTGGAITVSASATDIYGLRLYVSIVQHVVFFPNVTTFGDIIYEPALGLAQPALYVTTYRTTNWNGRMEAPGFLVSGGQIAPIPAVPPRQIATPTGALFPNWEKQVADITRYYDRFNPPDDPVLTAMARNLFGYAPKDYINRLAADDRTQFNFHRGTLKVKGTNQPYFAFARGTTLGMENLTIAEDWAWKFARYGDRRVATVLFTVNAEDFVDIYQVIAFANPAATDNRIIHIPQFSPPAADDRWVIPPPLDYYPAGAPYRFPTLVDGSVDLTKYRYSAFLVDQDAVAPATSLFHWDPAAGIHEPLAFSKIEYATPYDPARYNAGPLAGTDDNLIWNQIQVGQVWWDTSARIYSDYKGFLPDLMQTSREWGKLKYFYATITRLNEVVTVTTFDPKTRLEAAHNLVTGATVVITGADQTTYNGSFVVTVMSPTTFTFDVNVAADTPATGDITVNIGQINCYEWVSSPVPPAAWTAFVDSQSGFDLYSGVVLNADNPSYSVQNIWDANDNKLTTYHFWVESNTRLIPSKGISVSDIAGRLRWPATYEVPYFGIIDAATIFVFIGADTVDDNYAVEVSYAWQEMPRHVEWLLIGEGSDFSLVPALVTDKLVDSILALDSFGNPVPNATLAPVDWYGTLNSPAQTVYQSRPDAVAVFVSAVNQFLVGIDLTTIPSVFGDLPLSGETGIDPVNGFWTRATYWHPDVNHTVVYDTVDTLDELNYRATQMLYVSGDVVKVLETDQTDLWTSDAVAAYYVYDGTTFSIAGIDAHTASINANIASAGFRQFFTDLTTTIDILDANAIIFVLLHEMVRQNPLIDWFFKTSYIDPHVTHALPVGNFVEPDQASLIFDAILDLKPYRTKIRDPIVTYQVADGEPLTVQLSDRRMTKDTLVFDRLASNLNDEFAWDTQPWDATASYPESGAGLVVTFVGDGIQHCFTLPTVPEQGHLVVYVNGQIAIPDVDYHLDLVHDEVCFVHAPGNATIISVYIDSDLQYFQWYSYQFAGNGSTDDAVLPDAVSLCTIGDVFSVWNGVHQEPIVDFVLQVTSTTDVHYNIPPPTGVYVTGFVIGGVIDAVFNQVTFVGDGVTQLFATGVSNLTENGVFVVIDGVTQAFGYDYSLDSTNLSDIKVALVEPLATGSKIVIYAAVNAGNVGSRYYFFNGDGFTSFFAVAGGLPLTSAKVMVSLSGIEQIAGVDYAITDAGLTFVVPPVNGVFINVYVIWTGVGHRLTAVPAPATVQWDWAYWNYADLGRQEFDLVGVAVGDGSTTNFSINIPQTTTTLYNTKLQIYSNGVLSSAAALGLTITVSQLSTVILLDFSAPLPSNAYAALYVSRGLYEGLEPSFGYQDPAGIVFSPTPSSYQHYFARLVTPEFNPATVMSGFPNPEERVQTEADDMFTIVVKTYRETIEAPVEPPSPPDPGVFDHGILDLWQAPGGPHSAVAGPPYSVIWTLPFDVPFDMSMDISSIVPEIDDVGFHDAIFGRLRIFNAADDNVTGDINDVFSFGQASGTAGYLRIWNVHVDATGYTHAATS